MCDKVYSLSSITVSLREIWSHRSVVFTYHYVFCCNFQTISVIFVHVLSWNYYIRVYLQHLSHSVRDGEKSIIINTTILNNGDIVVRLLWCQIHDVSSIALLCIMIVVWSSVWAEVSVRWFLLGGIKLLHNA
jgi:hypothetical protein